MIISKMNTTRETQVRLSEKNGIDSLEHGNIVRMLYKGESNSWLVVYHGRVLDRNRERHGFIAPHTNLGNVIDIFVVDAETSTIENNTGALIVPREAHITDVRPNHLKYSEYHRLIKEKLGVEN